MFAAWKEIDPAHHTHGGQFESLDHTGGGPDQKIIKDQCQQQWRMEHNIRRDGRIGDRSAKKLAK